MLIKSILLAAIFEFVLCLGHVWLACRREINDGKEILGVLVSITHYWINLNIIDFILYLV